MDARERALLLDVPREIFTERLVLRAKELRFAQALHDAVMESLPELLAFMPWARADRTFEDTRVHCREMESRWAAREEMDFCLFRRSDDVLVGSGGLHTIDWTVPKLEIGYWIRSRRAGQGYATEAARALAEFAATALGAHRLEITPDARNSTSRRVAEKAGFVLEGIRRRSRRDAKGELADSCMYARVLTRD